MASNGPTPSQNQATPNLGVVPGETISTGRDEGCCRYGVLSSRPWEWNALTHDERLAIVEARCDGCRGVARVVPARPLDDTEAWRLIEVQAILERRGGLPTNEAEGLSRAINSALRAREAEPGEGGSDVWDLME